MRPEQLKNSILQLAIQGKLVEQRKDEGTGEELYKVIQNEKEKLLGEGKIKKQKTLPEISEDEIPFDIPENWKWVRLGDSLDVRDGTHDSPKYVAEGFPLVTSKNLKNGIIDFDTCKYISEFDHIKISERSKVDRNDILFAMIGSIGNPVLVSIDEEFSIKNMALFKNISSIMDMIYVYWFLLFSQEIMKKQASGGVQSFVSLKFLREYLLPLPPLAEQKRIVEKIEELLPLVEKYEKAWTRLEELNKKFPQDMKKSILEEAIKGKLVEQRKEEGTGEELFKEIQEEKKRLIDEGKLKKQKALPEITEDEIPFDIPDNWKWCYIGEIFNHISGKALNSKNTEGVSNVYWGSFKLDNLKEMYYTEDEIEKYKLKLNDLLVLEGGDVGRAAIWNLPETYCFQNHIHRLRPFFNVCIKYFYYNFMLLKNKNLIGGKGIGIKSLSSGALHRIVVPLPPLAEQKRIVEKIDELLPLCEKLR